MKIYLAAPFTIYTLPVEGQLYGPIANTDFAATMERIAGTIETWGHSVCLPHKDKGNWGRTYIPPENIAKICLDAVAEAEVVVALPGKSRGVHIELGFAAALHKKLILCFAEGEDRSIFSFGLKEVTSTIEIEYPNINDLLIKLEPILAPTQQVVNRFNPGAPIMPKISRAVVDLGSNTAKLYVASIKSGELPSIVFYNEFESRLADALTQYGKISTHIETYVIPRLRDWLHQVRTQYQVEQLCVYGTGAFRKAPDLPQAIDTIRKLDNVLVQVITQEDEARLIYKAAWQVYNPGGEPVVVLNIGGSSTEIVCGHSPVPSVTQLLSFGTRELIRTHIASDPLSEEHFHDLQKRIRHDVESLQLSDSEWHGATLFHTGGELDYLKLTKCPLTKALIGGREWSAVQLEDFIRFAETIRRLPIQQIRAMRPRNPAWMDGAIVCNTVLIELARSIEPRVIIPSDVNLAHALLLMPGNQ